MRLLSFSLIFGTLLCLLATSCRAAKFVDDGYPPKPGQPFEVKWTDARGAVTINLVIVVGKGPTDVKKVVEIACE